MLDSEISKSPTKYLRSPWLKTRTQYLRNGKFRLRTYDQPGRWMTDQEIARLTDTLREIAGRSMDAVPTYGVFTGSRKAFSNRVVGVASVSRTDEPVALTAMVYLPIMIDGRVEPVLHLGLTMIKKRFRGQRLQGPLFEKLMYMTFYNQLKGHFYLTNIAASPAGIGSVADYFQDAYPHYRGKTEPRAYHLEIAQKVLASYRHEFGCSGSARFDPETFVVKGSNDPDKGGAWQFIREDPVSMYKEEECNRFCTERLRFNQGDELFQVANVDILSGTLGVLRRLRERKTAARRADEARLPAMGGK
ncbi:MAG: hypothetical protein RBU30_12170 [Polyangia bacterium]|jgi:hypothetical protein|nr:hypothetical protein [Polyangia bacterium]